MEETKPFKISKQFKITSLRNKSTLKEGGVYGRNKTI